MATYAPLDTPLPYEVLGRNLLDAATLEQMDNAMRLPISRKGAVMPDGHLGYGLPVGGVLATEGAVIPYAVGVDISCSMCLSIYAEGPELIDERREELRGSLLRNTRFGAGKGFESTKPHVITEDRRWNELPMLQKLRTRALHQLGSSGGGNHFAEFGRVELKEPIHTQYGWLSPGSYLALMTHSGSRGLGYQIAKGYTDIAKKKSKGLPKELQALAWLDIDSPEGQEYWELMHFARDYALACHELVHQDVSRGAGLRPAFHHRHSHNLAWKEEVDGKELIVHRKGATPAHEGVLGIIPGTMADPGFLVRGKGSASHLNSSSHGAGRQMSRRQAKKTVSFQQKKRYLDERGIELIGGGLDEAPMAYKDVNQVIEAQKDIVDVVGVFQPRIVRMAD